jgi:hypothetical protein
MCDSSQYTNIEPFSLTLQYFISQSENIILLPKIIYNQYEKSNNDLKKSSDFTTVASQAYGGGQYHLGNGVYGMIDGDANADGTINLSDIIQIWNPKAGSAGYLNGDINLDRQVNNPDKNELWYENFNKQTQVPD